MVWPGRQPFATRNRRHRISSTLRRVRVGGNFLFQLLNPTLPGGQIWDRQSQRSLGAARSDVRNGQKRSSPRGFSARLISKYRVPRKQRAHSRRHRIDRSPLHELRTGRELLTLARLLPLSE